MSIYKSVFLTVESIPTDLTVIFQRYEEAASHLLDALLLQETDAVQSDLTARGVTSSALWDSLRTTFNQLQRSDLAALCDKRDLPGTKS